VARDLTTSKLFSDVRASIRENSMPGSRGLDEGEKICFREEEIFSEAEIPILGSNLILG